MAFAVPIFSEGFGRYKFGFLGQKPQKIYLLLIYLQDTVHKSRGYNLANHNFRYVFTGGEHGQSHCI